MVGVLPSEEDNKVKIKSADQSIKIKVLGAYVTPKEFEEGLATKQDVIEDLEEIRDNAKKGSDALDMYTADKPNLALKSELPTKVSDLENDVPYAEQSEINRIDNQLGELSDKIEDNKTNIENLVERVTTNEQNIVTLDENKAERSELQAEITNRENADKDLSDKIDTIEDDLTEDIDALTTIVENNYTTLNNRITEVASELEQSIEENVVALQQEDTALQNQINAHSQTLTAHDTRITNNATAISQETIARQNADDDLSDRIDVVESRGRFLALWNATTGLPESTPQITPYVYTTGDYYIVDAVGEINYKPTGAEFVEGQASTEIETEELTTDDVYYYDGAVWRLQVNHGKTVSFGNLTGQPSDNTALKQVLDSKQDIITDLNDIRTGAELGATALQKVPSEYVKNTDYATSDKGGVIKVTNAYGVQMVNGNLTGYTRNATQYASANANLVVAKGTLENIKESLVTSVGDTKYQNKTDNSLVTTDKTVVGAVNELDAKIKEIELYKSPNVLIEGEPTINNGQVTNLSKTNYLILPFQFDPKDRGFELTYNFRTGADVTTPQNLYGSKFSIASYVQNGKLTIRVSSNGTSWNVLDLVTSLDVQPNTTYYIKLIFNRLNYTVKSSTDGVEYSEIGYVVNTGIPFAGDVYIGIGNNQNNPFLGMINLHKWELKYNNSVFWEGMDDAGLATRADISLSNLDEEGKAKLGTQVIIRSW